MKLRPSTKTPEYLCQVSDSVSCGACCGLYNVNDASFSSLNSLLLNRTLLYDRTPNDIDAILALKDDIQGAENHIRPVPDFHHCPYMGLIGENRLRVGCLLHPDNPKNNGFDFRDLSHYGGMTCRVYFCPSTTQLTKTQCNIVKSVVKEWYLYGLIVTETRLLQAFFGEIEHRIQKPLNADDIIYSPPAMAAILAFFKLKIKWPFRKKGHLYLGNYFFNDNLYPKPKIDYLAIDQPISRYDTILTELASAFSSDSYLKSAEKSLDDVFSTLQKALS